MNNSLLPGFISRMASKPLCALGLLMVSLGAHAQQEALRIDNNGNVGIGTATPWTKLEVNGSVRVSDKLLIGPPILGQSQPIAYPLTITSDVVCRILDRPANENGYMPFEQGEPRVSIYASKGILSGRGYFLLSDLRIKQSFVAADTRADLGLLNQLRPTSFRYRDSLACGTGLVKGFVAQEVEQFFPQAITTLQDCIPNVYALAESCTLNQGTLRVTLKNPHLLKTGDVVRLISKAGEKEEAVVVTSPNDFDVAHWTGEADQLFVYSKRVNDLKAVDYPQLFTLGISATQQLSKDVDELKAMNESLRAVVLQLAARPLPLDKPIDASPTASLTGK